MHAHPPASPADPLELFRDLPVGVLLAQDEKIEFINDALATIAGRRPEKLMGTDPFELILPADRQMARDRWAARQRGDASVPARYELNFVRGDGSTIRLEIEPCLLSERRLLVLVRDVTGRARGTALVAALSELALKVQRCRTVKQALQVASDGLNALSLHVAIARLEGERTVYEHVAAAGQLAQVLDAALGRTLRGASFDSRRLPLFNQVASERRVVFRDDAIDFLADLLRIVRPDIDAAGLRGQLATHGLKKCAVSPLQVDGELWGFLVVGSDELAPSDTPGIGLFASQLASAIENSRTIDRLERRNRELAAVQQVAAAGGEPSLAALLSRLLEVASTTFEAQGAAIYLLDETGERLELACAAGQGRALADRFRTFPMDLPAITEIFLRLRAHQLDVATLPAGARAAVTAEQLGHIAVVPLHIKGRLAGTLALGRGGEKPFTADELSAADFLAGQMSIQVENARLFAEAGRRLRLLSTLFDVSQIATGSLEVKTLADRVLQQAMVALAVDGAAIHVLEQGKLVLAGKRGEVPHPDRRIREVACDTTTLAGRAVLERRTMYLDRDWWAAHPEAREREGGTCFAAMVPLISKERVLGTLVVARRNDQPFDREESRLLEALAAQVGAALDLARSFEEERRRVEDFKVILEVGRMVAGSLDLSQILESSAVSLARIAGATNCSILLLDPTGRVLKGVASTTAEYAEHLRTVRIRLDEHSVVAQAVLTGCPVRVPDVVAAGLARAELVERYGVKSLVALPLAVRDEAIGAVVIGDSARVRDWTEGQIERATVVARQVAVAVANARLYEDVKKSYDQLARAQEELVKRERLAALGELAAVVAHEVRNPLGVIFNSLRSLKRVLQPAGDAAMLLDIVGEEADRLNRIVGDLLDFARPSEPALQPEPLGAVLASVAEAASTSAAASSVKIDVQSREPLPKAAVDARMLRQALLNLVINAVQAMPRGGTVTLSAGEERREGRAMARIEVADTGPGIPPELAERIFQPFFTTKAAGTGLGLAVVKRIVEAHRGEVTLESVPGRGARFTLRLPLPG